MKTKVKRLKNTTTLYACRGCLELTNRIYRIKRTNVIACCPDCAREVIECKLPWQIPSKILAKMSKEQIEGIKRFWFPLERAKYPDCISEGLIFVEKK